ISTAPKEMNEENIVYNLLYGWDIRTLDKSHLDTQFFDDVPDQDGDSPQPDFVRDLILVHMIRNEMATQKPAINAVQTSYATTLNSAEGPLRYVATKNKFAEFYQWAVNLPHMQGVLLYYLSLAYPFACLIMILPGMHKAFFTWMSFWAWAKLWDLGFA